MIYYKLDENKNVVPGTMEECEKILINENNEKIVKQEYIGNKFVSTVFLCIDHNFYPHNSLPIVFETMIRDEKEGWLNYQTRCSTWQEAEDGHNKACQWVKDGCKEE